MCVSVLYNVYEEIQLLITRIKKKLQIYVYQHFWDFVEQFRIYIWLIFVW